MGDEPFICGGQAFICESSGTASAGGLMQGQMKTTAEKTVEAQTGHLVPELYIIIHPQIHP